MTREFSVHVDPDELEAQRLAAATAPARDSAASDLGKRRPEPSGGRSASRGKASPGGQGAQQARRYAFRRS